MLLATLNEKLPHMFRKQNILQFSLHDAAVSVFISYQPCGFAGYLSLLSLDVLRYDLIQLSGLIQVLKSAVDLV